MLRACYNEDLHKTLQSEWYGFASSSKWVEWYRGFLSELEIKFDGPTPIRHDNKAVKDLLSDSSKLGRTLHWRIVQAYPRFLYQAGTIECVWWDGTLMCADMLTKSLQFPRMSRHRRVLMGE